jgi:tetratricopeptide (TPR) repeat protein
MFKKCSLSYLFFFVLASSQISGLCFAVDISAQLRQAADYKENGYYNQAEEIYKAITSAYPCTDYALNAQKELVLLYLNKRAQKTSYIQPTLEELTTDFPENPALAGALYDIATECERLRNYDKAANLYQQMMQQYAGSFWASKAQIDIRKINILAMIEAGESDSTVHAAIENLLAEFSGNDYIAEALCDIAYKYRWFKKYESSIQLHQYVIHTWPQTEYAMWAQMGVAKSNIERRDYTAAQAAIDTLVTNYSNYPSLAKSLQYLAEAYRKSKKYQEVKNIYERIAQLYPQTPYAENAQIEISEMNILTCIDSRQNDTAKTAIEGLVNSFSANIGLPNVLCDIAAEYKRLGKYGEAANIYKQVAEKYPNNFRAHKAQLEMSKTQILTLIDAGEPNNALKVTDKLITDFTDHPYMPYVASQIAQQYFRKGTQLEKAPIQAQCYFQKAATICEKILSKNPSDNLAVLQTYCCAGDCYRKLGEYDKSTVCFKKVVSNYPAHSITWKALFLTGRNYQDLKKAGAISAAEADQNTKAAYEQLLVSYSNSKAAESAYQWLNLYKSGAVPDTSSGNNVTDSVFEESPLPSSSLSSLSPEEQEEAVSYFEYQHQGWLGIKDGTAKYSSTIFGIEKGQIQEKTARSQMGTLEFQVMPSKDSTGMRSPVKVQVRLFNENTKQIFVRDNIFDSGASSWHWTENSTVVIPNKTAELAEETELFFFPLDFMVKTYSDEIWNDKWNNKYMESKAEFFAGRGMPLRRSTKEETDTMFGGEQQYLFMLNPAKDAHYWFSAGNGELRQVDVFLPDGSTRNFRYENYTWNQDENIGFPQRFTLTWKKGTGEDITGYKFTVELTDIKLNTNISAERFVPPSTGGS